MKSQLEKKYYTREEYLAIEEQAEFRSEYWNGEIVPMTGGTTDHNQIMINLIAHLKFGLKGQGCRLFTSDVRLWIPAYKLYTYPDLMVVRGAPLYERENQTTVTNPSIIVEILSKSTQDYDRTDKFEMYRSIAEFQEYILVDQYQYQVEQYVKNDLGNWVLTDYKTAQNRLAFAKVDFEISFTDLYESVISVQASGES